MDIRKKEYYIDFDKAIATCSTKVTTKKNEEAEINIFKYEMMKMCIDRVLNNVFEMEDVLLQQNEDESYKIALNTLLNYKILNEFENE